MSELIINGENKEYQADAMPSSLLTLIESFNLDPTSLVAEVDGVIIPADKFSETSLTSGMKIELVKFVGGG